MVFNTITEQYTVGNFTAPIEKTVFDGTESISFLSPKMWDLVLDYFKTLNNVKSFRQNIRKWQTPVLVDLQGILE